MPVSLLTSITETTAVRSSSASASASEVDPAAGTGADARDPKALALEPVARAEHRLVLDPGGDDAVGAGSVARGPRRALHREVVALAPAAGEDDLARLAAAHVGDGLPCGLERRLRGPRGRVHARRVRVVAR